MAAVTLFHITTRAAWEAAIAAGAYSPASLASVGFIHLSTEAQWPAVAHRFYRGQRDLVLLAIRADAVRAPIRYEPADGDLFPHLYGPLEVGAVVEVRALPAP